VDGVPFNWMSPAAVARVHAPLSCRARPPPRTFAAADGVLYPGGQNRGGRVCRYVRVRLMSGSTGFEASSRNARTSSHTRPGRAILVARLWHVRASAGCARQGEVSRRHIRGVVRTDRRFTRRTLSRRSLADALPRPPCWCRGGVRNCRLRQQMSMRAVNSPRKAGFFLFVRNSCSPAVAPQS
jgi:hypothetical protein